MHNMFNQKKNTKKKTLEKEMKKQRLHKTLIHKRKKMNKFTCSKLKHCLLDIINGNTCI